MPQKSAQTPGDKAGKFPLLPAICGATAGSALAIALILYTQIPSWHRSNEQLPGAELPRWALTTASITAAIAIVYLAALLWGRRPIIWVAKAGAAAMLIAQLLWRITQGKELAQAVSDSQRLVGMPGVWNLVHGFHWVLWLSTAALAAIVFSARSYAAPTGGTFRHWAAAAVSFIAAGALIATGLMVTKPASSDPQVTAAQDDPAGYGEPDRVGSDWVHVPAPTSESNPGNIPPIQSAVPLSEGFTISAGNALAGYSSDGKRRRWLITFPARISFVAGTEVLRGQHDPWLLVQTSGNTTPSLITYAIDATSGQIAWSSDAFNTISRAAGTQDILQVGTHPTFAALIDVPEAYNGSEQNAHADLVIIDARTGQTQTAHQYRDACQEPSQLVVFQATGYSAVVAPEICGTQEPKLQMYDLQTAQPHESLTSSSLGGDSRAALAIADARGPAMAITMTTGNPQTDRSVVYGASLGGQIRPLPNGYLATALLGDSNAYTFVTAATDPQGHQSIIYTDMQTPRILISKTAITTLGRWAYTSSSVVSAGGYSTPQTVERGSAAPQLAPLTIVTTPQYPYTGPGRGGNITLIASPCRQGSQPHNQIFQAGRALLLWCKSNSPASNEVFALS